MTATPTLGRSALPASHVLGRKLDSIPFSAYHVVLIVVLGFVGFIEGYDLALTRLAAGARQGAAASEPRRRSARSPSGRLSSSSSAASRRRRCPTASAAWR